MKQSNASVLAKLGSSEYIKVIPPCLDRGHDVPSHMVFPAGTHVHRCPACGTKTTFVVRKAVW